MMHQFRTLTKLVQRSHCWRWNSSRNLVFYTRPCILHTQSGERLGIMPKYFRKSSYGGSRSYSGENKNSKDKFGFFIIPVSVAGFAVLAFYLYRSEKLLKMYEKEASKRVDSSSSFGERTTNQALAIGGDFLLVDHTGKQRSLKDFKNRWLLMYFGFCHCPDICPDQMEKMVQIVERLRLGHHQLDVVPVFVSIDPERDTPEVISSYLSDFSPKFIGLTGKKTDIEAMAKSYRIYYSKGPVDSDGDYIVDHAIIMYLVDPNGRVLDYYGQTKTEKEIANSIANVIARSSE